MILTRRMTNEEKDSLLKIKEKHYLTNNLLKNIFSAINVGTGLLLVIFFLSLLLGGITALAVICFTGKKLIYFIPNLKTYLSYGVIIFIIINYAIWIYIGIKSYLTQKKVDQENVLKIEQEIKEGLVTEETYNVEEAICFIEIEHGGLSYFLKLNDGRIMFIYDYESPCWDDEEDENLSEQELIEKKQEKFLPTKEIKFIKSPITNFTIKEQYLGEKIKPNGIYDFFDIDIPEHGEFINYKWDELIDELFKKNK
ncbi:MAG: hypothetical protein WCK67_02500 [bacterium]